MADRYVNYDKLLEKRHHLGLDEISVISKVNAFNRFINRLPTADVDEVKHGKWRLETDEEMPNPMFKLVVCSVCNSTANGTYNYCPNCGAKMDKRSDTK